MEEQADCNWNITIVGLSRIKGAGPSLNLPQEKVIGGVLPTDAATAREGGMAEILVTVTPRNDKHLRTMRQGHVHRHRVWYRRWCASLFISFHLVAVH